jgi:hypothetical protein
MKAKTDRVDFNLDIDIDRLMAEGLAKCKELQEKAEKQSS